MRNEPIKHEHVTHRTMRRDYPLRWMPRLRTHAEITSSLGEATANGFLDEIEAMEMRASLQREFRRKKS